MSNGIPPMNDRLVFVLTVLVMLVHCKVGADTIDVCSTCSQTSIRDAIDDADDEFSVPRLDFQYEYSLKT